VSAARESQVRIEAGPYFLRTLVEQDASERWAGWAADPGAAQLLNAPVRRMTKGEIVDYIRSFDQSSRLLLGIFDKESGTHIGIYTIAINRGAKRGLLNALIGEPEFRNRGVFNATRIPLASYCFETLGLRTLVAAALAHNQIILNRLLKDGWVIERTLKQHVRSQAGDRMLDLCLLRYSYETWKSQEGERSSASSRS
jgi:RimJ/RimL family protein N-acetyltransferase